MKFFELTGGKFSDVPLDKRDYRDKPSKGWRGVGAVLHDGVVNVDIDDYSHKTDELVGSVRGEARSEVVVKILDSLKIRYVALQTPHGKHLYFRRPRALEAETRHDWHCPLGILAEWLMPEKGGFLVLRTNGVNRPFIRGKLEDIENGALDELPPFLYPIQKSKDKPFSLDFPQGDRTQKLGAYLFHLVQKMHFCADDAFRIVRLMNEFVFEHPIPAKTLDVQVLNPSTLDKLREKEQPPKEKREVNPATFKDFLSELGISIKYNALLNIVEFENIPNRPEFCEITDVQNQMPTALQYCYREYTGLKSITKLTVVDLVSLEADKHTYNPVGNFLTDAKWDNTDRLPEIYNILGVTDKFEQVLIRKWFYQTAALAFNSLKNPIQPEGVLILAGDEGLGKTRFFRMVSVDPLWFHSLDKPLSTKIKDTLIETLSAWITEIGEIDRTFTERRSDLKNFMTAEKDSIRKPYAREPVIRARTTSMCGTTNKTEFLNDETGSRRWWVVKVSQKIAVEQLTHDFLSKLWAQCHQTVKEDLQCFRLTDDELKELSRRNKKVFEMLPGEEELRLRLDFDAPESEWRWIQTAALKNLPEFADIGKYDVRALGKALMNISRDFPNIINKRSKYGNKWPLPPTRENTDRCREISI